MIIIMLEWEMLIRVIMIRFSNYSDFIGTIQRPFLGVQIL